MTQFCTYDEKGRITESHLIPDGLDIGLFTTSTRYILGPYTSQTHYIKDGAAVAFPPRPPYTEWDWDSEQWVVIPSHAEVEVRAKRQRLLQQTDWTDTVSAKDRLGDVLYNAWQDYRQILRDVPQQPGFPFDVQWPDPPSPT